MFFKKWQIYKKTPSQHVISTSFWGQPPFVISIYMRLLPPTPSPKRVCKKERRGFEPCFQLTTPQAHHPQLGEARSKGCSTRIFFQVLPWPKRTLFSLKMDGHSSIIFQVLWKNIQNYQVIKFRIHRVYIILGCWVFRWSTLQKLVVFSVVPCPSSILENIFVSIPTLASNPWWSSDSLLLIQTWVTSFDCCFEPWYWFSEFSFGGLKQALGPSVQLSYKVIAQILVNGCQ